MILKHIQLLFITLILSGFAIKSGYSTPRNDNNAHSTEHEIVQEEEFNAGQMIIDHIIDSYEWHLFNWGHTHYSVYLPVIIYHEGSFVTFMSSEFVDHETHQKKPVFIDANGDVIHDIHDSHGSQATFGLAIMKDGPHKGKIAYIDAQKYINQHNVIEDLEAGLPWDISITKNVVALWFSILLIILVLATVAKSYKTRKGMAPKGLQSVLEPLVVFIRDDIAKSSIGEKKHAKYLPYLLTIFFFIFFNNLLGLIPILPAGANVTGNIAITMVLAIFTFVITTFSANKNYWVHMVNTPGVPWWLKFPIPLMPVVEIMGLFIKPFVLMVRLFANITAGHIIVLGFMSLIFIFGGLNMYLGYGMSIVSIAFSIFLSLLEFLVAFIQAYVFTLLSALYIGAAVEESH